MKKRVEKMKAKPVAARDGATRKALPVRTATVPPAAGTDPLQSLLRGTYAQRACESRGR
jgi:hypothetical protein